MNTLPNRPEDLRRFLKRLVRDDPDRYLQRIERSSTVALRAGRPFNCTSDSEALAEAIAQAAAEMIRARDVSSQTLRRARFYDNRKDWREGDPAAPGPDTWHGVRDWPEDESFKVQVSGLGSQRANEIATVSAILLTDDYLDHRKALRRLSKEREQEERDCARMADASGKSATRKPFAATKTSAVRARTNKYGGGTGRATSGACVVTPSKSSNASETLSQFSNWKTASEDQRAAAMARVIYEGGQGLSVTIDLSPEVVEQAKASRKSTMSHLRERFTKLLKRRLDHVPDMVLVGEQGFAQDPHIHGVIDLPDTPEAREAVRSAGLELSGMEKSGKASARVVDIQKLYDPEYWIGGYASKYRHSTRKRFGAKRVVVATQSLSRRARTRHAALKASRSESG